METDYGAVLTVRAAARGALDFRAADIRDPNWWRKVRLITGALASESAAQAAAAVFAFECALVGNSGLKDDSFGKRQEAAIRLARTLGDLAEPWAEPARKRARTGNDRRLVEAYKRLIGDPDDPQFKARQAAAARAQQARVAVESDEQAIARKIRAKNRRRK